MTRRRNSDERIRGLERQARQDPTPANLVAWWRAMVQGGSNGGQATIAVLHAVNRATRHDGGNLFFQVLELLFSEGWIKFDQHDDAEVIEAFRRIKRSAPDTGGHDTYCETNDCDDESCHRCFTREGCRLHSKCRDFASRGEAEFVEHGEAVRAMRWVIFQRALNDGSSGWGGPDLANMGDDQYLHEVWAGWVREDAFANADEVSRARVAQAQDLLVQAIDRAWELDYPEALEAVARADDLMNNAAEDKFICTFCEQTRYDRGQSSCPDCGEPRCSECDLAPGGHPGYHDCADRCAEPGCDEELSKDTDSDYCAEHRDDEGDDDVEPNPYYGRAGSGLMLFSSDGRRVLLTLRSDEVAEPGTWGIPGGKLEGRDAYASALREVDEELGSVPPHSLFDKVVFDDDGFRYTTFLARLGESTDDWSPELNWESDDVEWFDVSDLPDNLHFGVRHIVAQRPALFRGVRA